MENDNGMASRRPLSPGENQNHIEQPSTGGEGQGEGEPTGNQTFFAVDQFAVISLIRPAATFSPDLGGNGVDLSVRCDPIRLVRIGEPRWRAGDQHNKRTFNPIRLVRIGGQDQEMSFN